MGSLIILCDSSRAAALSHMVAPSYVGYLDLNGNEWELNTIKIQFLSLASYISKAQ